MYNSFTKMQGKFELCFKGNLNGFFKHELNQTYTFIYSFTPSVPSFSDGMCVDSHTVFFSWNEDTQDFGCRGWSFQLLNLGDETLITFSASPFSQSFTSTFWNESPHCHCSSNTKLITVFAHPKQNCLTPPKGLLKITSLQDVNVLFPQTTVSFYPLAQKIWWFLRKCNELLLFQTHIHVAP